MGLVKVVWWVFFFFIPAPSALRAPHESIYNRHPDTHMLPFLNKKKRNPTIMATLKPGGVEMDQPMNEENHGLLAASADLLAAFEAKDVARIAMALQAAYELCEQNAGMEQDSGLNSDG